MWKYIFYCIINIMTDNYCIICIITNNTNLFALECDKCIQVYKKENIYLKFNSYFPVTFAAAKFCYFWVLFTCETSSYLCCFPNQIDI